MGQWKLDKPLSPEVNAKPRRKTHTLFTPSSFWMKDLTNPLLTLTSLHCGLQHCDSVLYQRPQGSLQVKVSEGKFSR